MSTAALPHEAGPAPGPRRVLVLFEAGRSGEATIEEAGRLVEEHQASLTVVSFVPQGASGSRCGGSARDYNLMLRDTVAGELQHARRRLGGLAARTRFELLIEGRDPRFAEWAADGGFDVILLPARRRLGRGRGHPELARLRRRTQAEVWVTG